MSQTSDVTIDQVFRRIERLAAVGICIGSLERLRQPEIYEDEDLLGWKVAQDNHPWPKPLRPVLDRLLSYPNVLHLHRFRLLAGAALLARGGRGKQHAALAGALTGSTVLLTARDWCGQDGSDHMSGLVLAAVTLAKLFPDDEAAQEACLWFIALQACISYSASGFVKVLSPVWRDGSALPSIMRTRTYGEQHLFTFLSARPTLSKWMARGLVAGEFLFPVVLVLPGPLARGQIRGAAMFHGANAVFMGLNRFFWAFAATHPAIEYCARRPAAPEAA